MPHSSFIGLNSLHFHSVSWHNLIGMHCIPVRTEFVKMGCCSIGLIPIGSNWFQKWVPTQGCRIRHAGPWEHGT